MAHGDDFTFAGSDEELSKFLTMMSDESDIKVRGKLGPDKGNDKSITILNRCVTWTKEGIIYEADAFIESTGDAIYYIDGGASIYIYIYIYIYLYIYIAILCVPC